MFICTFRLSVITSLLQGYTDDVGERAYYAVTIVYKATTVALAAAAAAAGTCTTMKHEIMINSASMM